MKIIFALLCLTSVGKSLAQDSWQKGDYPEPNSDKGKTAWVSVEYGLHSRNLYSGYFGSGGYGKLSLDIPVSTRVSVMVFVDRWTVESFDEVGSVGVGVDFMFLSRGKVDMSTAPAFFRSHTTNGIVLPATVAYRIFDDKYRLQATMSYRAGGELSPVGNSTLSFYSVSLGLGIAVDRVLSGD